MEKNSHLEWKVNYIPGTLEAIGYKNGKKILSEIKTTTGIAENIKLSLDKENSVNANVSVVTVEVTDKKGLHIPTANNEIVFSIKGGKILGVGNGDPTSLESDKFIDNIQLVTINNFEEKKLASADLPDQITNDSENNWAPAFKERDYKNQASSYVYRGKFELPDNFTTSMVTFFYKKIGTSTVVFVNGNKITPSTDDPQKYILSSTFLKQGTNTIQIIAPPLQKARDWDVMNTDPGIIQVINPAEQWKRKLFNGYAQIIIQMDENNSGVILSASAKGLKAETLVLKK
jgi:beta-galactosidase